MAVILPIVTKFSDAGIRKAQSSFGGLGKSIKSLAGVAGLSIGIGTVVNVLKDSVTAASNLGESLNAVNVAYGKNAKNILALGQNAATSIGLSTSEFNSLAVGFSSFTEKIAGDGGDVVGTFKKLSERGADFASVFNLSGGVNEALEKFRSGLAGETEPLRKYGIDMSAAAVETFALSTGLIKSKKQLTENVKIQARYGLLMEQTSKTQGDFANTSDSLANRQRIVGATIEDLKAKFGNLLLPVMEKVYAFINDKVLPVVTKFVDDLSDPKSDVGKMFVDIKKAVEDSFTVVKDFFALFGDGDAMKGFANVVTQLVKALPALLALKGIMMLASAGKSIANLAKAIGLMTGASAVGDGTTVVGDTPDGKKKKSKLGKGASLAGLGTVLTILSIPSSSAQVDPDELQARSDRAAAATALAKKQPVGSGVVPSGGKLPAPTAPKIPKFADGGIVMPSPGGSIVNVAEAGQAEAIIPLNKMASMGLGGGATYNITVNAGAGANGGSIGTEIVNAIKAFERSNGKGWRS
jgi:hypothetical protein